MITITAWEFVEKYLDFFKKHGHAILPNVSLVPKEDPTTLFINSGVQPIEKYLAGESHPLGKRLASVQRCVRTKDLEGPVHDSVGDSTHHVLFHMLGNWSLGDYFKKETITWSYQFLVDDLHIDPKRIWVTIFAGDQDAPFDQEAKDTWLSLGIPDERIIPLGKEDNWWGPAGLTGPCGPDTEIFVDRLPERGMNGETPGEEFKHTERFIEVWNNVFSQYYKDAQGTFTELSQKNVDTGMGLERTIATLQGFSDNYQTELFLPIIEKIESLSGKAYPRQKTGDWTPLPLTDEIRAFRIIAEHARSSIFMAMDGVTPSNKEQGYILRRIIRRLVRFGAQLGISEERSLTRALGEVVISEYVRIYPQLSEAKEYILTILDAEEQAFTQLLRRSNQLVHKIIAAQEGSIQNTLTVDGAALTLGAFGFYMFETYGLPEDVTLGALQDEGIALDEIVIKKFNEDFALAKNRHEESSRAASAGRFAGGLADHSAETTKLHTATHLLHKALRTVLGEHVQQMGSNITKDRLRFDFSHDEKLTDDQITRIEQLVNEAIRQDLSVIQKTMPYHEAIARGALAFFQEKYPETVSVYVVGDEQSPFSMELCGGPHVDRTGDLGLFRVTKQESVGKGVRRLKATLEATN